MSGTVSGAGSGRTRRVGTVTVGTVGAAVLTLAVGSCAHAIRPDAPSSPRASSGASLSVLPSPGTPGADAESADTTTAVAAAVRYELLHCSWDWHTSFAVHLAAEAALATPAYASRLRAQADLMSWQSQVVRQRQVVSCGVLDARLASGAPNSDRTAFVRLILTMHVESMLGSFDTGTLTAACLMRRIDGSWLVDGPFQGG